MSFQRGFTLIEVLITAFVLATVTVAITGLGMLSTRSAIEAERENVATAIANEEIETARTYSYAQIRYTDVGGKIEREKVVRRNDQDYIVKSFITLKDDPANGTLPEGTELTEENADFKQLSVEVSWTRPSGGDTPAATSSTVVAATFFANKAEDNSCTPGNITCYNGCTPGESFKCPDKDGEFTLPCPDSGACEGQDEFLECPASGQCPDPGTQPPGG
ncbi:MAG: prepilin-type N-terminal cleavage/methylation domain-containing protein, partial [Patescibacteria group bacterium]